MLRIPLPRADRFQLEEPGADAAVECWTLEALDVSQARRIDGGEPASEAAECPDLLIDRTPAQILEQIIVKVHAVECRVGGMSLVQPREVFINEVGQGFGGIHSGRICAPRMTGILYVVATPIGNLEDVTLRALRILREVSLIAAEDTRRTNRLLQHYSISTPTTSLREHNERRQTPALLARLSRGESIALVSDAGTPLVSDPGESLVAAARAGGFRVESVPGPSAILAALSSAGVATGEFTFLGFPPIRSNARNKWFQDLSAQPRVVILYEAPHRLRRTLQDLTLVIQQNHAIVVARELTKVHEELVVQPISWLLEHFTEPKGEFTILVPPGGRPQQPVKDPTDESLRHEIGQLIENEAMRRREAVKTIGRKYGLSANKLYNLLKN